MWCEQTQSSNQPCDVRDWENSGIHRSVSRQLNTSTLSTGEFSLRKILVSTDLYLDTSVLHHCILVSKTDFYNSVTLYRISFMGYILTDD